MQQDIGLGSSPIGRNDEGGGTKMCFNNRGFRPAVYTNEIMPPDRFLVDVTPATTGCGVKPAAQPVSFGKVLRPPLIATPAGLRHGTSSSGNHLGSCEYSSTIVPTDYTTVGIAAAPPPESSRASLPFLLRPLYGLQPPCFGPMNNIGVYYSNHRPENYTHGSSPTKAQSNAVVDMKSLASALIKAREGTGEVENILVSARFCPRLPGLTKLIGVLSKQHQAWRKALEVYQCVGALGLEPDTALTNAAISACDRGGQWEIALQLWMNMDHRDNISYSAMISALAKGKQWSLALEVFCYMMRSGCTPDVITCCSLISALDKGSYWQLAERVFLLLWVEQLEQVQYLQLNHKGTKDIQPCDIQYLQHIWGFSQAPDNSCGAFFGASEPSLTLWEWTIGMEKEGDDIASGNRQTGSLLYSVEQQNTTPNLTRVETAARDVKSPSTPPPMGSHLQSSGSASSRHGRPAEVTQYSPDAPKSVSSGVASQKAGESSSNLSKNSVLQSIWSPTENEHATFASAFSSGGISNDTMCRAVAGAMQNSNATAGKWIPDRCVPQLGHNLAPYGHRPCNWPPEGMLSNSTECFQNPQPTTEYVSSMLSKLSLKQEPGHHCVKFREKVQHAGQTPAVKGSAFRSSFKYVNTICCNALLSAYANATPPQWDRAVLLLSAMQHHQGKIAADCVAYNTVMKACRSADRLAIAYRVLGYMMEAGVEPSIATFNTMISAALSKQDYEMVLHLWGKMREVGVVPSAACANSALIALEQMGRWDDARAVYSSLARESRLKCDAGNSAPVLAQASCPEIQYPPMLSSSAMLQPNLQGYYRP